MALCNSAEIYWYCNGTQASVFKLEELEILDYPDSPHRKWCDSI